jgi:23S rRNA (pseudouridine1915-N3)-methyltransferase
VRNIFLFLGKTRESFLAQGIDEYSRRLKRYAPVELKVIKEKKGAGGKLPVDELKREEGLLLLKHISQPTLVVALDQGGRRMNSVDFSEQLFQWENQGQKTITFLIGGPNGLSVDILGRSDLTLSLSDMTLTHEMARLLILEQVYRAYTIKAGTGYHK